MVDRTSRRPSPTFEQFPGQPPFSPPDSDDMSSLGPASPGSLAESAAPTKKSWLSNLFSFGKDKAAEDEEKESYRTVYGPGPPSPPTSVMSSAASMTTVKGPSAGSSSTNLAGAGGPVNPGYYAIVNPGPNTVLTRSGARGGSGASTYAPSVYTVASTDGFNNSTNGYKGYNNSNMAAINGFNASDYSNINNYSKEYKRRDLESPTKGPRGKRDEPRLRRQDSFSSTRTGATVSTIGTIDVLPKSASRVDLPVSSKTSAVDVDVSATVQAQSSKKNKKDKTQIRYPDMVLPELDECLKPETKAQGLMSWVGKNMSTLMPGGSSSTGPADDVAEGLSLADYKPLAIVPPPKVHKAVAIGIHGFFPIRMVRSIIGEPTGTSVKFANEAAAALRRWADRNECELEIEKIALEGEGIVLDRVENLYRLLMNWINHLYEADFIFIAAHSQGTPVAVQLAAKLIEEGQVDNKRIAIMGMAGISLGPMYGLDQKLVIRAYTPFESDSLKELFAFQNSRSLQSRRYIQALRTVIAHGVKIAYIGSVNDPLIPLYSSTCVHVTHPYIFRAIFVDGKVHAPTFIIHLVALLMKLRNMGIPDHGILREVSEALGGTLTGGGHSNIYNEGAVYDVAIRHALETSELTKNLPVRVQEEFEIPNPNNFNPYHLPWNFRGMLEDDFVRKNLGDEIKRLLVEFEEWNPDTKPLKDIKFRLNSILFLNQAA
ncbi:uncharacterized protein V1510DRAFT_416295 [Dipodascopsis tothii]|uniref:uncharacterized protein n=1 Tax=Dipodascopsis tothii TaxID=44089 RepID=UPI0034CD34B4